MTPTIYRIEFPDGKFYIGATKNFAKRRRDHLQAARKGEAVNTKLSDAFKQHGTCAIYQIASGFSLETLHMLEGAIIAQELPALNVVLQPTRLNLSNLPRPRGNPTPERLISAGGVTRTLTEWVQVSGVSKPAIYSRIYAGWTEAQAVGATPRAKKTNQPGEANVKRRYIEAGGNRLTLDQWAAKLGITAGTIQGRLRLGWTEAQAVGIEPSAGAIKAEKATKAADGKLAKKQASQITYKGVTGSISDVCRHHGVQDSTIRSRIALGWLVDEAFEVPLHNYRHQPKKSG